MKVDDIFRTVKTTTEYKVYGGIGTPMEHEWLGSGRTKEEALQDALKTVGYMVKFRNKVAVVPIDQERVLIGKQNGPDDMAYGTLKVNSASGDLVVTGNSFNDAFYNFGNVGNQGFFSRCIDLATALK